MDTSYAGNGDRRDNNHSKEPDSGERVEKGRIEPAVASTTALTLKIAPVLRRECGGSGGAYGVASFASVGVPSSFKGCTNVLDLTDQQVTEIKQKLDAYHIGISAIASPIGKVPIDTPFGEHLQLFERAIALAQFFKTPFIRIFSFYPPAAIEDESAHTQTADIKSNTTPAHMSDASDANVTSSEKDVADPARWRDEVLRRLRELTRRARNANLILLHENEKAIYGDTIARCTDLLQSMNDPHFQAICDPAKFIQC
jgi:sugar phosphate isomerase/epimerase